MEAKVLKRLKVLENRINTLEIRINMEVSQESNALAVITDTVSDLNATVRELEALCTVGNSRPLQITDQTKMSVASRQGNENAIDAALGIIVRTAFQNEKRWIREKINIMDERVVTLEKQEASIKLEGVKQITEETEALKTALNQFRTESTGIVEKLQTDLKGLTSLLESNKHNDEILQEVTTDINDFRDEITEKLDDQRKQLSECKESRKELEKQYHELRNDMDQKVNVIKSFVNTKFRRLYECPDRWTRYDLFCYHFFDVAVEFQKARELCANIGANVVDVSDATEMKFVMGLVGTSNFWIGLTDTEREGTWKWDRTGAVTAYTNWRPGQPDNRSGSNQDCAIAGWQFPKDMWNDQGCSYKHAFVCKKTL